MPATVRIGYFGGSATEPAAPDTSETGIKWNQEDTMQGIVSSVPAPPAGQAQGQTNFSWIKNLAMVVTAPSGSTTGSINNRTIRLASAEPGGTTFWFKAASPSVYQQATAASAPASTAADATGPAGYTRLTQTPIQYDNTVATSNPASVPIRNGVMVQVVIGLDRNYAGGAGTAIPTPSLVFTYDEV